MMEKHISPPAKTYGERSKIGRTINAALRYSHTDFQRTATVRFISYRV